MAKAKKRGKTYSVETVTKKEASVVVATDYALNLIASIIVLISEILFIVLPWKFKVVQFLPDLSVLSQVLVFGIIGLLVGIGMLIATLVLKFNPREASVFILVFSIIALIFPPHGFVIGPLMGIIGSILVLVKLKR
jgi:hypothetical protein